MLAGAALVVTVLAAGLWWLRRGPSAPTFRQTAEQNILLITIDTLRADALGSYGGRAETPVLDRLAALGMRFEFAHAHAVVTLPAHASILTGLYPFQHGIHDNAGFRLSVETPTLATHLRAAGMATGAFIGAFPLDSRFGLNRAFEIYDERYGSGSGRSRFRLAERRADTVVAAATAWIGAQQGRWLAWVHVFDPHGPYQPPAPFDSRYANEPYAGEVAFTDQALGPLLEQARQSPRPTLVVATGDHGEALGDHGEVTHGVFAYEPTLRIPLIVTQIDSRTPAWSAPADTRTPYVSAVEARHIDLLPTVLDALGMEIPSDLPGRSLLPGAARESGPIASYFEALTPSLNRGWAPLTGLLVGREKYIDLPLPEMYDLLSDPGEQANIVGRSTARQREFETRLRGFRGRASATRQSEDPETLARLRALGYVTGTAEAKAVYTEDDDPKRLIDLDRALHQAVDLYERRRPREAVPIYEQVLARRPATEVAWAQLAMLHWEMGDPAAAIATLRRAAEAGVSSFELRSQLGIYLAESDATAEALPLLGEITRGDHPDLDALNALGIAQARSGATTEATATFQRLLQLSPSNSMALENLGLIALRAERIEEARDFLSRALQADPASPQALNGLGAAELRQGNRRAAIEHWRRAVELDPSNFDALYNVAVELVHDGQPAAARPYLERFAAEAPHAFYAKDIRHVQGLLSGIR